MNKSISESDYQRISGLAYRELIDQGCNQFLIRPTEFTFPDREIVIASMQYYARLTGTPIERLLPVGCRDGYVYRNTRPGLDLILYNAKSSIMRMRFTVAHEIGHARLKHRVHTPREEAEAHLFACQLLAPDVIMQRLKDMGVVLNPAIIASMCGLSISAAEHKFADFSTCENMKTEYDEAILRSFGNYVGLFMRRRPLTRYEASHCDIAID